MHEENKESLEEINQNLLETLENSFDWNLIFILSIWIFLLSTFFLIYF